MKSLVLVKIGTNILRDGDTLALNRIAEICTDIKKWSNQYRFVIVSSGAVGAGQNLSPKLSEKDPLMKKQMWAAIGQGLIFQHYSEQLQKHGIIAAQALYTKRDLRSNQAYRSVRETLKGLIQEGIVPVINENDTVSSDECSFGDNDQLASLTAAMIGAEKFIILSDIKGLFTADPKKDPSAKPIAEVREITPEIISGCSQSFGEGGTGGMYSKIRAAEFSTEAGIYTYMAFGKDKNSLDRVLSDNFQGTVFYPVPESRRKPVKQRATWMKRMAEVKGEIHVDEGAVKALKENKSLLVVGISKATGQFSKADVVAIKNPENATIGVGLTDVGQDEWRSIAITKPKGKVFIHKNHLFLF